MIKYSLIYRIIDFQIKFFTKLRNSALTDNNRHSITKFVTSDWILP